MFWDSSAVGAVLLHEDHCASLVAMLDPDRESAFWWSLPVECYAAVVRAHSDRRITSDETTEALERLYNLRERSDEVPPTEAVRHRALRILNTHRLRASDAFQLAAALVWSEEHPMGASFVCLDKRLREAARREGFTLLPAE